MQLFTRVWPKVKMIVNKATTKYPNIRHFKRGSAPFKSKSQFLRLYGYLAYQFCLNVKELHYLDKGKKSFLLLKKKILKLQ